MKFNFFERKPVKSEYELEQDRHIAEVHQTLDNIELNTSQIVEKMSPDEVNELDQKLGLLLRELPRDDLSSALYLASKEPGNSIPEFYGETEIIPYINSQPSRVKELFIREIENSITELDIGEQFRKYDKDHWEEVFQRRINSGITPLGDERNLIKDIFLKQGIDLKNPTEGDINAYFQRLEYNAGAIGSELYRRTKNQFQDVELSTQAVTEVMLHRLLDDEIYKKSSKKYDRDARRKRLQEIKEMIEI
jgi:hypothetical protein